MKSQIPPPLPGRPHFVEVMGARVYISVHDHFHKETLRRFRRQLLKKHPDRNRHVFASAATRKILRERKKFLESEVRWYAHFGLLPPGHTTKPEKEGGRMVLATPASADPGTKLD